MTAFLKLLVPVVASALIACVITLAATHRSTPSVQSGHRTAAPYSKANSDAPLCSLDGNYDNDAPGCVVPKKGR